MINNPLSCLSGSLSFQITKCAINEHANNVIVVRKITIGFRASNITYPGCGSPTYSRCKERATLASIQKSARTVKPFGIPLEE